MVRIVEKKSQGSDMNKWNHHFQLSQCHDRKFTRKFVKQTQSKRVCDGKRVFFSMRNQKANGLDTCVHNNTWSRRKKSAREEIKKNENTRCFEWMNEN